MTIEILSKREPLEGTPFVKETWANIHNGACQCYGDCDCYKLKGLSMGEHTRYTHPLKDKRYATLKACEDAYYALKGLQPKPPA